jgi:hypothetical protein
VTAQPKQTCLKPQDLIVALKIALSGDVAPPQSQLRQQLLLSTSEISAATRRAAASGLLERDGNTVWANRQALQEFVLHGMRYAFPATLGVVARGMPTGGSAPLFSARFDQAQSMPWVWPDGQGELRGPTLCPLYPSVPAACRLDPKLYDMLAALDALRAGAAREREAAQQEISRMLS